MELTIKWNESQRRKVNLVVLFLVIATTGKTAGG